MTHLFLTGQKGAGKSTLIRGLLAEETGRLGGFFTVRHEGGVYLLPAAKERTFTPESLCSAAATAVTRPGSTIWAAPRWRIPLDAACW